MTTPVFVTFDRSAMPTNLLTVMEWRRFAREAYGLSDWRAAARRYAEAKGGALVMRADDSLLVLTKLQHGPRAGRISQRTYKPGRWGWAQNRAA